MSKEPSPAQKMIGDFAPQLVDLTDRVLFGEVWERISEGIGDGLADDSVRTGLWVELWVGLSGLIPLQAQEKKWWAL
jgi:hypothetical protein